MNKERLLKLAEHIESGELGHKKFDFRQYNLQKNGFSPDPYSCGYAGCAIGECPIIFPEDWVFNKIAKPVLKNFTSDNFDDPSECTAKFFDLRELEVKFLFYPGKRIITKKGLITYSPSEKATRQQIAKHIKKFVEFGGIYKRRAPIQSYWDED